MATEKPGNGQPPVGRSDLIEKRQPPKGVKPPVGRSNLIEKRQPADKPIYNPAIVPQGKTYYLMENGKVVKKFRSGSTTVMGKADCVVVKCPVTFPDDVVCWKCYERPDSELKPMDKIR
jgi:hypothetical protein